MDRAAQRGDVTCLQPHSLLGKESGRGLDHSQVCIHWTTEGAPEKAETQTPLITNDTRPPKKKVLWVDLALTPLHCTSQLSQGPGAGPGRCSTGSSVTTPRGFPVLVSQCPQGSQTQLHILFPVFL